MSTLKPSDLLVIVMHSRQEPWESIVQKGQLKTWVPDAIESGVEVVYCSSIRSTRISKFLDKCNEFLRWHAGSRISDLRNLLNRKLSRKHLKTVPTFTVEASEQVYFPAKIMSVRVSDTYYSQRWRGVAAMKYFIEQTDARFLAIITSATYLQSKILIEKLSRFNEDIFFGGSVISGEFDDSFISGAQMIFNKRAAQKILDNMELIPGELLNDLGLNVAIEKLNIQKFSLSSTNLQNTLELNALSDGEILREHHFRLKSFQNGIRIDTLLFNELSFRLENLNSNLE